MAGTLGKVYDRAACRYCADEISVNALNRHEEECQNLSDEEKLKRKQARLWHQNIRTTGSRVPKDQKPWQHHYTKCKYCGDDVDKGRLAIHEKRCENDSPAVRETRKAARIAGREAYRSSRRIKHPVLPALKGKLDEPVIQPRDYRALSAATRHAEMTMESNGKPLKPMRITMVLDEDQVALTVGRAVLHKLPEVLALVLPGFSVTDFKVK